MADSFGLSNSEDTAADEVVGEERLAHDRSVIGSLGITQLLLLLILGILVLIVVIAIVLQRKVKLSEKC